MRERLKQLEFNWVGIVIKNCEFEQSVLNMEQEISIPNQRNGAKKGEYG